MSTQPRHSTGLFCFHRKHLNVKLFLCVVAVAVMLSTTPKALALFGHVAAEKDRREHAEQQLTQQQVTNQHLFIVISVLSAGVVVALIIGAAVGSKTRRDHDL